jgi:hypothetical protein
MIGIIIIDKFNDDNIDYWLQNLSGFVGVNTMNPSPWSTLI